MDLLDSTCVVADARCWRRLEGDRKRGVLEPQWVLCSFDCLPIDIQEGAGIILELYRSTDNSESILETVVPLPHRTSMPSLMHVAVNVNLVGNIKDAAGSRSERADS